MSKRFYVSRKFIIAQRINFCNHFVIESGVTFIFYDRYLRWCEHVGKSPSAVATDIGLEKSTVTRWKQGGEPSDTTKRKIANYFGVSVQMFMEDKDDTEELFTLLSNASPTERSDIIKFAMFLREQKKEG